MQSSICRGGEEGDFFFVIVVKMDDVAGLQEAAGTRFSQFELIGRGSFGDVYKA